MTGQADKATADINRIRLRSNLTPLTGTATMKDLYHERRRELAFEFTDHLFDADSLSGLERYLYSILGWEDAEEQIFILENILLHSPEATDHSVPSREFTLTAILSQTERTQQRPDFQLRLEEFLREKIPAHLRFTVHWLPPKELALFVKDYKAWRKAWADNDNKEIGRTGEILKNNLIRINIEL